MDPNYLIAILAFLTIGGTLGLAFFHYRIYLRDPKNLAAARTVVADLESAATRVSSEGVNGRTLRQRLDDAPALEDRLSSRPTGLNPIDVLFTAKWSDVRRSINISRLSAAE